MKLAPRVTLAIAFCGILLFGGSGALQLWQEERDLENAARKEALLLGRSLQVAFENALRDRQIEDVTETFAALVRVDPEVAVFVYDEEGKLVGASSGAVPSDETVRLEAQARASIEPILEFGRRDGLPLLRTALKLREETPTSASSFVVEKPLPDMQRDLSRTQRSVLLWTVGFVLAVAGLTWLLTRHYVSGPLARMVSDMRRVRSGDLAIAATTPRADEVGAARTEFDSLVHDLDEARARADREMEARQRAERALQHADKLVTLGQLAAVMAHEIGSPLQILEGRARALYKHAIDEEATKRTADILIEQTTRMTKIVSQMLSITRRRTPARSLIDAEPSVRSVVALLELEARRRSVRMQLERQGNCEVFADADQLQQVALNLLRNALEASPPEKLVVVRIGGEELDFVLEVIDQGAGLSEETRRHLFEPFFTTKSGAGGTGLGLSVTRAIVQEHHGRISFPETRHGSVVRVILPRMAEGAAL